MTQEQPPNPPPTGTPGDKGPDPNLEQELDDLLSRASALAADLSKELGPPEGSSRRTPPTPVADDQPSAQKIEAGFSELDQLVTQTKREVVGDATEPTDASESTPYYVPDFMAEFTQPEAAPAAEPSRPSAASQVKSAPPPPPPSAGVPKATSSKPGVIGTATTRPPGGPARTTATPTDTSPSEHGASAALGDATHTSGESPATGKPGPSRLTQTVSKTALSAARTGVAGLEWLDRPFRAVGPEMRRVLGLLSLATIGVSLILLVLSLI